MKKLLFALCLFVSGTVFALVPQVGNYSIAGVAGSFSSAGAACDAKTVAVAGAGSGYTGQVTGATPIFGCNVVAPNGSVFFGYSIVTLLLCPSNSDLSGSSCACKSGFDESGGSCISHQTNTADVCSEVNAAGAPLVGGTGTPSLTVIYKGVAVTGRGAAGGIKNGVSTGFEVYGPFTCAATSATPGTSGSDTSAPLNPASTPTPSTCSGYWGTSSTVNGGEPTCFPKVPAIGNPGVITGTTTETTTASDGTGTGKTSTGTTSCDGLVCTTVTSNTPTGQPATTTTKTEPQESYCQANPGSAQCQSDPCKDSDTLGCSKMGTAPTPGNLPSADSGLGNVTPVSLASSSGCPPSLPFIVMGRVFYIRYDAICSASTSYIKPVILLLAAAASVFLFTAGFKV